MYKTIQYSLLLLVLTLSGQLYSQEFDPFIQENVDQLNYDSLYLRLQQFEELGIKEIGTQNLDDTGNWIINFYQQNGYSDIKIDSFYIGQDMVYNIIVTKTGAVYPDTYLIIDGHYDTSNGPGVNDNGSGTATILEIARMMKDIETAYSIKFIHFTAEEIGLVGSTHYVENTAIPEELDIRLLVNIDEVGGVAGEVNNTVTCERDEWAPTGNNVASAAFTDTLANLTELYTSLNTYISFAYGSDYVPFMNNNFVVTGLYEFNESPYPHTINDNLANLDPDYVFEITKASLAATLYFSSYLNINTNIISHTVNQPAFEISPNPFDNHFELNNPTNEPFFIKLIDMTGMVIFTSFFNANSKIRLGPDWNSGMYLIFISSLDGQVIFTEKIIKQ